MSLHCPDVGRTPDMEQRGGTACHRPHGRAQLKTIMYTLILWSCLGLAKASIWDPVLERSCSFEFQPIGSYSRENLHLSQLSLHRNYPAEPPSSRMMQIGSFVGDKFDPKIMQEAPFDYDSISAWPTNPWTTSIACGAMLSYDPNSIMFHNYTPDGTAWPEPAYPESDPLYPGLRDVYCEDYLGPVRHPVPCACHGIAFICFCMLLD
jgi:hypothetical protein